MPLLVIVKEDCLLLLIVEQALCCQQLNLKVRTNGLVVGEQGGQPYIDSPSAIWPISWCLTVAPLALTSARQMPSKQLAGVYRCRKYLYVVRIVHHLTQEYTVCSKLWVLRRTTHV